MVDARVKVIAQVHDQLTELIAQLADDPDTQGRVAMAVQMLGTVDAPELPYTDVQAVVRIRINTQDGAKAETHVWTMLRTHLTDMMDSPAVIDAGVISVEHV